jgi:hypothetical protein
LPLHFALLYKTQERSMFVNLPLHFAPFAKHRSALCL